MKLTTGTISFTSLDELKSFINRFALLGILQLADPIKDNSDNVLFAEEQLIKQTTLERLTELKGQYKPAFKILMNNAILKELDKTIADIMLRSLQQPENGFINHLFSTTFMGPKPFILNALRNSKLALILFKFVEEKPDFFYHCVELGLTSLGIALQQTDHRHMINTYSFIAGISADLALMDSTLWKDQDETFVSQGETIKKCSTFAKRLGLPDVITDAIARHTYDIENPDEKKVDGLDIIKEEFNREVEENPLVLETLDAEEEHPESEKEETTEEETEDREINQEIVEDLKPGVEEEEKDKKEEENKSKDETPIPSPRDEGSGDDQTPEMPVVDDEGYQTMLLEILRVTRYIHGVKGSFGKDQTREIIQRLAYNSGKGYFSQALVDPVIALFQEFDDLAAKMRHIASVEKRCIMPPSAWAYPKPNSTQIICVRKAYDCNFILTSRDIHIIDDQQAFGHIGRTLTQGYYPKCKLEELLYHHDS